MARMGFIFALSLYFSVCGLFTVKLGFGLFHAENPSAFLAILFLVFSGGALFLLMHLVSAFTAPLPNWYINLLPPISQPETKSLKRKAFIIYASLYLTSIAGTVVIVWGTFAPEQIAWLVAIGMLSFLLLSWLLSMLTAFLSLFKKDGKTSHFSDRAT